MALHHLPSKKSARADSGDVRTAERMLRLPILGSLQAYWRTGD